MLYAASKIDCTRIESYKISPSNPAYRTTENFHPICNKLSFLPASNIPFIPCSINLEDTIVSINLQDGQNNKPPHPPPPSSIVSPPPSALLNPLICSITGSWIEA